MNLNNEKKKPQKSILKDTWHSILFTCFLTLTFFLYIDFTVDLPGSIPERKVLIKHDSIPINKHIKDVFKEHEAAQFDVEVFCSNSKDRCPDDFLDISSANTNSKWYFINGPHKVAATNEEGIIGYFLDFGNDETNVTLNKYSEVLKQTGLEIKSHPIDNDPEGRTLTITSDYEPPYDFTTLGKYNKSDVENWTRILGHDFFTYTQQVVRFHKHSNNEFQFVAHDYSVLKSKSTLKMLEAVKKQIRYEISQINQNSSFIDNYIDRSSIFLKLKIFTGQIKVPEHVN